MGCIPPTRWKSGSDARFAFSEEAGPAVLVLNYSSGNSAEMQGWFHTTIWLIRTTIGCKAIAGNPLESQANCVLMPRVRPTIGWESLIQLASPIWFQDSNVHCSCIARIVPWGTGSHTTMVSFFCFSTGMLLHQRNRAALFCFWKATSGETNLKVEKW